MSKAEEFDELCERVVALAQESGRAADEVLDQMRSAIGKRNGARRHGDQHVEYAVQHEQYERR